MYGKMAPKTHEVFPLLGIYSIFMVFVILHVAEQAKESYSKVQILAVDTISNFGSIMKQ